MAHYIRYEVYLPIRYRDSKTGAMKSVEPYEIAHFLETVAEKYGGYTQSNPVAAPPFRGFWKGDIDELVFAFILVPSSKADTSLADFTRWKSELERKYRQELILIIHFPVQVIGEL